MPSNPKIVLWQLGTSGWMELNFWVIKFMISLAPMPSSEFGQCSRCRGGGSTKAKQLRLIKVCKSENKGIEFYLKLLFRDAIIFCLIFTTSLGITIVPTNLQYISILHSNSTILFTNTFQITKLQEPIILPCVQCHKV